MYTEVTMDQLEIINRGILREEVNYARALVKHGVPKDQVKEYIETWRVWDHNPMFRLNVLEELKGESLEKELQSFFE